MIFHSMYHEPGFYNWGLNNLSVSGSILLFIVCDYTISLDSPSSPRLFPVYIFNNHEDVFSACMYIIVVFHILSLSFYSYGTDDGLCL